VIDPNTRNQLGKVFFVKTTVNFFVCFIAAASNFSSALRANQRTGSNYFYKGHFLIP